MKKLLFLTAAIGFAFSVNAQQVDYREQNVPASTENLSAKKMDMQLVAKPATFLKADVQMQKSAKSTNVTYTYAGEVSSADFATFENNGIPQRGNTVALFPDSVAFPFFYRADAPDSSRKNTTFMSMGYVFDPYSSSFDMEGTGKGLFSSTDTFYGYKIDTVYFLSEYRIANYDPNRKDTLRFYAFTLDIYNAQQRDVYNLGRIIFNDGMERKAVFPNVRYANPIPQKGIGLTPKANYITWDYILTTADSVVVDPGYVRGRVGNTIIPGGGMEVDPGSVFVFLAKFIPGYDYNLNDTISITSYNQSSGVWGEDLRKNRFSLWYWEIPDEREAQYAFWDNNGYNTHLVEDKNLRYAIDTTDWGNGAFYHAGYYAKAMFYFSLYQSDDFIAKDPQPFVTDPNQPVSAIYPNPVTSALTIDLKAEGLTDITVYNILGQAVLQDQVSNLSNTINVSGLSQGMYVVKIKQNGKTSTVKFSKQ